MGCRRTLQVPVSFSLFFPRYTLLGRKTLLRTPHREKEKKRLALRAQEFPGSKTRRDCEYTGVGPVGLYGITTGGVIDCYGTPATFVSQCNKR